MRSTAQVYPYTYMDHIRLLDSLEADPEKSKYVRVEREWTKSLAGNTDLTPI